MRESGQRAAWWQRLKIPMRLLLGGLTGLLALVIASAAWSRLRAGGEAVQVREIDVGVIPAAGDRTGLMVGCYNIAHGRGGTLGASNRRPDGKEGLLAHLRAIGEEIQAQGLDLVVLNEVDFSSSWSWRVNQAEVIGAAAGLRHVFEHRSYDLSLFFYQWRFGNAILSRYPITDAEPIRLPAFKALESLLIGKKEAGVCTIESPLGRLRVVAVHLDVRDQATREASMVVLGEYEAQHPDLPHLILGDFNTQIVFAGVDRLRSAGGFEATFPSAAPSRRIDWIFSSGLELGRDEPFGGDLSDHLGLRARVIGINSKTAPGL